MAASKTVAGFKPQITVGAKKTSGKLPNVAKPVVFKGPVSGKATSKAQPMYTKKPSKAGRMSGQYGTGITSGDNVGFRDKAPLQAKAGKQKLNQG